MTKIKLLPFLTHQNDTIKKSVIYIHGKGGTAEEAEYYKSLLMEYDVYGLDYEVSTPWELKESFQREYDKLSKKYAKVIIIANSIGAFFAMNALGDKKIEKAFFISPIVNMEKLITDMMLWANVSESELREKKRYIQASTKYYHGNILHTLETTPSSGIYPPRYCMQMVTI